MSVVNRMLQDIDHRIGSTAFDAQSPVPDIRGVPPRVEGRRQFPWLALAAVVLVATGALVIVGRSDGQLFGREDGAALPGRVAAPPPVAVMQPLQPPAPANDAAPMPATDAAVAQGPPATEATAPPVPREPVESFKLSFDLSPLKAPARRAEVAHVAKPNKASGVVRPVAAAPPPVTVRAVEPAGTVGTAPAASVAVRQVAAGETVASARLMWLEGSRNSAYATLREALASAEASRDPQATRTLALELARLELAGNRAQAALDLLRRHGALLGEDADALALRGNAQQRLVLHAEAAESYLAALRLRPTEGNWMLGAAISLAADGRTEEAQAWANRARDRGAITPPVAAYLQQLGVAMRP